uniref:Uncharacterized protein n=1 Tax=viral metagenome TaxID=1070528 RepID=A0A6C0EJJ8_9ZZZZ
MVIFVLYLVYNKNDINTIIKVIIRNIYYSVRNYLINIFNNIEIIIN